VSPRTGVPRRMWRNYEKQALPHPERAENGYRWYGEPAVYRVQQTRGLLDAGLTTEIIRGILPFLTAPGGIVLPAACLTAETAGRRRRQAARAPPPTCCPPRHPRALPGPPPRAA